MSSLGIFDKETKTYKKVADLSKPAVIDSAMSDTSTNAVQNKVVKSYVDDHTVVDSEMSSTSTNAVQNKVVKSYVDTLKKPVAWDDITGKPSTYTPSSHTHDDRYYTESEIDTRLNNKSNVFKYDFSNHDVYICLGTATLRQEGDYLILHIYCGSGFNANIGQDRTIDVHIRASNGIAENGMYYAGYIESHLNGAGNCNIYVVQNSSTSFTIWIGKLNYSGRSFYEVQFPYYDSWVPETNNTSKTIPTNGVALRENRIAYTDYVDDHAPNITVDASMSDTSTNPVQNKVIKKYVDDKQVNIDGVTLTLDEARNVIKLADTLKDKIGSALQPESIVNNQITTETGYALDARQANPNINGTLAKKISDLNGSLENYINGLNPSGAIRLYLDRSIGNEGAGWYRFAKIVCGLDSIAKGATYIYIETLIHQTFSNTTGCFHKIYFYLIYSDSARISVTGYNTNVLKRVRIVRSGNTIFLDVYCNGIINGTEMLSFIPFNSGIQSAENVNIHLVPETADGEVIVRSVELANDI